MAGFPLPGFDTGTVHSNLNRSWKLKALLAEFAAHNEKFLVDQKIKLQEYFSTVEEAPLTDEQMDACICMDDAVQVVAAAGSGKTSTMVAKAGYAMKQGLAEPDQILMLAFNKDAAIELKQRVKKRLALFEKVDRVVAETFHAFGLHVIGTATGKKPSLARWAEPGQDVATVSEIITFLERSDSKFAAAWDDFQTIYARDILNPGDDETPDSYANGVAGFRTASGIVVKSEGERTIANWLYFRGIRFEYERPYEHETADKYHGQYRPDFFYPDINLYHEHFAIKSNGASFEKFVGYMDGVAWKRDLHKQQGTKLFETTFQQFVDGDMPRLLEAELRKHGLDPKRDHSIRPQSPLPMDNRSMARLVRVFQQHVKGNGLTTAALQVAADRYCQTGFPARIRTFLSLYLAIAGEWQRRLEREQSIDFDDMLLEAAAHVESGRYVSPFQMVLADEFQDSSRARIRLLKALTAQREGIHLCAVGDDWQGINRFAGADISVMNEFERNFSNSSRLALGTTFRFPQTLCDASSAFIQKNPAQIKKEVKTTSLLKGQSVFAFGFAGVDTASRHLESQLNKAYHSADANHHSGTSNLVRVMILGRYRSDKPAEIARWQRMFRDRLAIDFRTIHSAKGLGRVCCASKCERRAKRLPKPDPRRQSLANPDASTRSLPYG
nr:UvrD-helicase domain-containing protein [Polymorphobacter fuscus]